MPLAFGIAATAYLVVVGERAQGPTDFRNVKSKTSLCLEFEESLE
jgi:hypothetical protein